MSFPWHQRSSQSMRSEAACGSANEDCEYQKGHPTGRVCWESPSFLSGRKSLCRRKWEQRKEIHGCWGNLGAMRMLVSGVGGAEWMLSDSSTPHVGHLISLLALLATADWCTCGTLAVPRNWRQFCCGPHLRGPINSQFCVAVSCQSRAQVLVIHCHTIAERCPNF